MTASSNDDRRRFTRHESRRRAVVILESALGAFPGTVRDVSHGGILFVPRVPVESLETNAICLALGPHRLTATIIGHTVKGMHCRFPTPIDDAVVKDIAVNWVTEEENAGA